MKDIAAPDLRNKNLIIGPVFRIPSKCSKCGNEFDVLWPIDGGLCDKCLRNKIRTGETSIREVKKQVCECLHKKLIEILAP